MKLRTFLIAASSSLVAASLAVAGETYTPPGHAYHGSVPADQRHAYFGELHLHTTMSFDAWTFGTKIVPDQAYKFARGETVMVPAIQIAREQHLNPGADVPAKRAWPLDFTAVTDHSEYLGAMTQLDDPNSAFSNSPLGKTLAGHHGQSAFLAAANALLGESGGTSIPTARDDAKAAAVAADGWNVEMKAANDNYEPGKFTTFIAYEWTASPGHGIHMHRNVIFDADHAPAPFTAVDSNKPEDLWKYLESVRAQGIDVLAIPHNSNLSDGRDFDWNMSDGRPIDEAYASERALNEPLVEIAQIKGSSDTRPELSPDDEFANFEIMDRIYAGETKTTIHGSYIREAYGRGLVIQSRVGVNPFKMGLVGDSDIHNGLSASDENAFAGGNGGIDPATMTPSVETTKAILRLDGKPLAVRPNGQVENDPLQGSSAAITGVWAEENTRDSIFAALKRKETFATSGVRIRLRAFGGWTFSRRAIASEKWVAEGYAKGVPMGGDLPMRPRKARAPQFALWAVKDPSGANLDRIQVIKVWLEGDNYREKVFNAALSDNRKADPRTGAAPAVGNTVDLSTGDYKNTIGAAELKTLWTDPEFNPKVSAVYYVRVLQIPTARWSTLLALKYHLPLPTMAPATIQERAWSSPIWYTPAKG